MVLGFNNVKGKELRQSFPQVHVILPPDSGSLLCGHQVSEAGTVPGSQQILPGLCQLLLLWKVFVVVAGRSTNVHLLVEQSK